MRSSPCAHEAHFHEEEKHPSGPSRHIFSMSDSAEATLTDVPVSLLSTHISCLLDLQSLCSLAQVNKLLRDVVASASAWELLSLQRWRNWNEGCREMLTSQADWHGMYSQRHLVSALGSAACQPHVSVTFTVACCDRWTGSCGRKWTSSAGPITPTTT